MVVGSIVDAGSLRCGEPFRHARSASVGLANAARAEQAAARARRDAASNWHRVIGGWSTPVGKRLGVVGIGVGTAVGMAVGRSTIQLEGGWNVIPRPPRRSAFE